MNIEYPATAEEFYENFKEAELAYCSLGYDSCLSYLLPTVSSNEEFQNVLKLLKIKKELMRCYQ